MMLIKRFIVLPANMVIIINKIKHVYKDVINISIKMYGIIVAMVAVLIAEIVQVHMTHLVLIVEVQTNFYLIKPEDIV